MASLKIWCNNFKVFQKLCWLVQLSSAFALARLMSRRCSCIIEEYFPDLIDNRKDDYIVLDALDFVFDAPGVLDLNEKIVEEEVILQLLQVDSYDMLLHVIEENQEASHQEQIYEATYGNVRFDQQVYENIMPIFHVQSEPVYGSIKQQAEVTIFSYQSTSFYDPVAIYVDLCFS